MKGAMTRPRAPRPAVCGSEGGAGAVLLALLAHGRPSPGVWQTHREPTNPDRPQRPLPCPGAHQVASRRWDPGLP